MDITVWRLPTYGFIYTWSADDVKLLCSLHNFNIKRKYKLEDSHGQNEHKEYFIEAAYLPTFDL